MNRAKRKLLKSRRRYAREAVPTEVVTAIAESARLRILRDLNAPAIGPALAAAVKASGILQPLEAGTCQDSGPEGEAIIMSDRPADSLALAPARARDHLEEPSDG